MRITTKFIGSSAVIITLAALLSGSSYVINRRISQTLDLSYTQAQTNVKMVVQLEFALKDQITALNRLAVLIDHPEEARRYRRSRQTFLDALAQLEKMISAEDQLTQIRLDNLRQQSLYLERIAEQLIATSITSADRSANSSENIASENIANNNFDHGLEHSTEHIEEVTRSLRLFDQQIKAHSQALLDSAYEETARHRQQQTAARRRLALIEAASFSSLILLLILQFYGLVKPVLKSLTRLQTGAAAIGNNVQDAAKIDLGTKDELQRVADAFNHMSDQLKESYQALEAKVAQRTASLNQINQSLQQEVCDRIETEKDLSRTLAQLQKTQLQLLQAEKMSGLSQLVSGVAHEINNPASFIRGNLAPAESYMDGLLAIIRAYQAEYPEASDELEAQLKAADIDFISEDFPCLLQSIESGVKRITSIVRSLQIFSHKDESDTKSVDIHQGIDSALLILSSKFGATAHRPSITLRKDYAKFPNAEFPRIYCYPAQLNQVFMGLLTNAIEALEKQTSAPTLTVKTSVHSDHIQISVADNGIGMDEATQSRVFDPFFTTKPVGDGCGMSLAMSYQIVTVNHQGNLTCQSQLGQGTTFTVSIPRDLKIVTSSVVIAA